MVWYVAKCPELRSNNSVGKSISIFFPAKSNFVFLPADYISFMTVGAADDITFMTVGAADFVDPSVSSFPNIFYIFTS